MTFAIVREATWIGSPGWALSAEAARTALPHRRQASAKAAVSKPMQLDKGPWFSSD
jgi:hypothetical protein